MGIRFQKKINLLPGVNLNLSKSGIGVSVGPKGAKVSINSKGDIFGSVGIPNSGLSYREKINKTKRK